MRDYIDTIIIPHAKNKPCLLLLDDFAAHKTKFILDYMKANNITPYLIPGGYTYCLQPLDVSINKPFKQSLRQLYNAWNIDSSKMSKNGIKSKPSWQDTINMVDSATRKINSSNIRNSFAHCGFNLTNNSTISTWINRLNHKLKETLIFEDDWDIEASFHNRIKVHFESPYQHASIDYSDFKQPYEENIFRPSRDFNSKQQSLYEP